jgi:acyl-CoA synthetase (AMP-forming)/AMP-acid ligase II
MANQNKAIPPELSEKWQRAGYWQEISLRQAMAQAASDYPDALLYIHGPNGATQATLSDIHRQGQRLAGSLYALGLRPGDTIAMQLPNRIENAVVFQAAAMLGCLLLPIVHIYGPAELNHILADSNAAALIVPDRWKTIDFTERLENLNHLENLRHRIVLGENVRAGAIAWDDLPEGVLQQVEIDPAKPALLLYTSGTTAAPKGALHSSRTLFAELLAQSQGRQGKGGWFAPWPSGHIAGTIGILAHALLGRTMVMLESWDAAAAAALIEQFKVEQSSGAPFHLAGLLEAAKRDGRNLGSLRQFIIGATPVPPAIVAASEEAGIRCTRCYGSTELPTFAQCDPDDPLEKRLNTDGRLNPGCEVRFVDEFGNDVPAGAEGELAGRAPERFLGYTEESLNKASFLPDGWFLTGDIGRMDADGFITITDRKKDIIIRGGEKISSREVEDILMTIPGVREAAAIGWPDAKMGERVCAVLLAEGQGPDLPAISAAFQRLGVARQKTPERLEFVSEFPRTASGKIQKSELRRILLADVGPVEASR